MVFICDFCEKICVIRVLNKKHIFYSFRNYQYYIKTKAGKFRLSIICYLKITIRLPALITLRYFHFLQDRQEVR